MRNFVLTSESVTAGHPDKLCDRIADALVDACLAGDPAGGIVAECALASGVAFVSVRHRRPLAFDPAALARRLVAEAGYGGEAGAERTAVMLDSVLDPALPGPGAEAGAPARQMTTVFGHACGQTAEAIPLPLAAAHRLTRRIDALRGAGDLPWLLPDAQAQVAVRFAGREPAGIAGLALTLTLGEGAPAEAALRPLLDARLVAPAFDGLPFAPGPGTRLALTLLPGPGGPRAHAGLTGRKTADDTYGLFVRHGSSALSGKDPGRIDRIGAYAAREAARAVLAAGLARECEVQLAYVPGEAAPVAVEVDSFGTGALEDGALAARLAARIDFRPGAIAERLGLWRLPAARGGSFYRHLAAYGHFGRADLSPPWEEAGETAARLA